MFLGIYKPYISKIAGSFFGKYKVIYCAECGIIVWKNGPGILRNAGSHCGKDRIIHCVETGSPVGKYKGLIFREIQDHGHGNMEYILSRMQDHTLPIYNYIPWRMPNDLLWNVQPYTSQNIGSYFEYIQLNIAHHAKFFKHISRNIESDTAKSMQRRKKQPHTRETQDWGKCKTYTTQNAGSYAKNGTPYFGNHMLRIMHGYTMENLESHTARKTRILVCDMWKPFFPNSVGSQGLQPR